MGSNPILIILCMWFTFLLLCEVTVSNGFDRHVMWRSSEPIIRFNNVRVYISEVY